MAAPSSKMSRSSFWGAVKRWLRQRNDRVRIGEEMRDDPPLMRAGAALAGATPSVGPANLGWVRQPPSPAQGVGLPHVAPVFIS
jgi:hypothetical protein